jgi:hypothetical protein
MDTDKEDRDKEHPDRAYDEYLRELEKERRKTIENYEAQKEERRRQERRRRADRRGF